MRAKLDSTRILLGLMALVLVAGLFAGDAAAASKPWEKFKFPPLGDVTIPNYERHQLSNGMIVFLLEDHTWPLVEGQAIVRTGAAFEPASMVGLASIVGDVLRTGGTTNIGSDALDEELERMGGSIESGIGDTSGTLSFSFLTQDLSRGLELVADVLRNPAYEQDKIDVAMEGMRATVARRNDDLNGLVGREIQRAVWGNDHPYARNMEYSTLEAIARDDVVGFYEYFYHPDNMMLAVWGDFDPTEMLAELEARFGDWAAGDVDIPEFPNEPQQEQRRRVLIADKTDVNQARLAMGHIGMRADDPDYYAISVANRILGGGFGDRLFNEVRTNRGLAYNVGSTTGVGFSSPGVFQAYVGTKSETTEEALGVILDVIEGMRTETVEARELNDAKEAILNSNVFNYVQPQQVLTRKMNLEYLGYPDDFLETYNEKIRAVDDAAVLDVMQRRVNPDEFAIVAVGKTEDWDGDLTAFGPVEELDISIPEPEGPEFPEPTDETVEKGRGILAAAQTAHGGSALTSMKSMVREATLGLKVQGMDLSASATATIVFPDKMHMSISLPFGEMVTSVSAESAWMQTPQGLQDMPGDQAEDARAGILEEPLYLVGNYDSFPVQALDAEEVDGTVADVVLVWTDDVAGSWVKLYFDPNTSMLVKTESKGDHPFTQTPGIQTVVYTDYKSVDGVQVSHSSVTSFDGEEVISTVLKSFKVNSSIDDSMFTKPQS